MDKYHLKLLKELSKDSTLSQRNLSNKLALSLGKVNYVLNALLYKAHSRRRGSITRGIRCYLCIHPAPDGIKGKVELTYHFLQRKIGEYDTLKMEIKELKKKLGAEHGE